MVTKYWLGKKRDKETNEKIRKTLTGRKLPDIHKLHIKQGEPSGKNHHAWKENAGYRSIHSWVNLWNGKANHCEMCGSTNKKRYHWANIDHTYKRILEDYIQLCPTCHYKYDGKKK